MNNNKTEPKSVLRLRKFLEAGGQEWGDGREGEEIWDLISALRGPDDGNEKIKDRTTWRLRYVIALQFFEDWWVAYPLPDQPQEGEDSITFYDRIKEQIEAEFPAIQPHFLSHYVRACWVYWGKGRV